MSLSFEQADLRQSKNPSADNEVRKQTQGLLSGQIASLPTLDSPSGDLNTHFYKKKNTQVVTEMLDEEDETRSTKEHI